MSQIIYNPFEYSKGGDIEDFLYENCAVLRAVNVNWNDDGWNVNAYSIENPNEWNAGNRIFSAIAVFLLSIWQEFC